MSAVAEAPTAAGLEAELRALRGRRGDLDRQLREAVSDHEAAQAALVRGDGPLDAVQSAQGRHSALREALTTLDGQITDLTARHEALAASERREQIAAALVQIAQEADAAVRRYTQANREAQAALEPHLATMAAALRDLLDHRNSFIKTARHIVSLESYDPQARRAGERLLSELEARGGRLNHVLGGWKGSLASAHDRETFLPTPGEELLSRLLADLSARKVLG